MFEKYTVFCLITVTFFFRHCLTNDCVPKDYGHGSFVCVCNASYCDTVEPLEKTKPGEYVIYTSSKDGLRLKKSTGKLDRKIQPHADEVITLTLELKYQEIQGWGGAFTDAAGYNIKSLNAGARDKLLRTEVSLLNPAGMNIHFTPSGIKRKINKMLPRKSSKSYYSPQGIEYTLGRVPIGCSDLSLKYYSYDEVPDDINLKYFNLTKEDFNYKIPFIKDALSLSNNSLKLFASTWTAPLWMKTNNKPAGLGFLKKEYYQTWANYHIKFFDAYKKEGLNFWGVTTGNEPLLGITPFFDITSLGWYPWDQGKWISENLGPAIRNNSEYKNIKIISFDDERLILPWWLLATTLGNKATDYIDGIGVHWYTDPWFPSLLTLTHMFYPNKFILGTEACTGDKRYKIKVLLGSWRRGEQYVEDIIEDMDHWVTGWVDWNIALNLQGGPSYINNFVDSSIIVNKTAQEFYKQPTYYAMGHFSKFVPPGSYRTWIDLKGKNIQTIAFIRPDKGVVVVLLNRHDKNKTVSITDGKTGYINLEIPPRSVSTVIYWPDDTINNV